MSSILDDFKKLSNVRIGSFGKFIFNNSILNASNNRKLERKHSNFADFVLNGVNTGVKTTRKDLFNRIKELKIYTGKRFPNIQYAQVEFFCEGARVSIENEIICITDWIKIERLFKKWRNGIIS